MKKSIIIFLGVLNFNSYSWGMNVAACSAHLNNGLYKKYKYMGEDGALGKVCTKKNGSSTKESSSEASPESTTASSDPKYTVNKLSSVSQYFSSWGPCSFIGLNDMKEQRDRYYAQNQEEILREIAMGRGEHLLVLADMSLCETTAREKFVSQLQNHMEQFINLDGPVSSTMDKLIENDQTLTTACFSFGS